MVKLLKVLVTGKDIELVPFSFEKPIYADIPKIKEYTSQNEHALFEIEKQSKKEERNYGKRMDLIHNMKKNRKYFGNIHLKKVLCFARLIKKLQKENIVKSCYLKLTKKKQKPILYINDEKLGVLEPQIKSFLKKYKKIRKKKQFSE